MSLRLCSGQFERSWKYFSLSKVIFNAPKTYTSTHTHMPTHTRASTHTHTYTHIHTPTHTPTRVYTRTPTLTHGHTRLHKHTYALIHTHTHKSHIHATKNHLIRNPAYNMLRTRNIPLVTILLSYVNNYE